MAQATVTDKEVQQARSKVDKLREQIAAEEAKIAENSTSGENLYRKVALDAEAERLQAQLAALKELAKPAVQREETEHVIAQVQEGITGAPIPVPDPPSGDR